MNTKEAIDLLRADNNYQVIERLQPGKIYIEGEPESPKLGVYVDVETTGLDCASDEIIEIALVPFIFSSDGKLYRTLKPINMLQEPADGIVPDDITMLTGITSDDVKGHSINWQSIRDCIEPSAIIIAHNAGFDRPFLENSEPLFAEKAWGCSCFDIDWKHEGLESSKLEYLGFKYGFFYEGHRATIDCYAGLEVLSRELPKSGEPAMKVLLDNARRPTYRIWAEGAPYDLKDHLKARGYRWSDGSDGKPKAWYIDIDEESHGVELKWLDDKVYQGSHAKPPVRRITAFDRHSKRL